MELKHEYFTTNDDCRLHYIEAGAGKPLVMIPGWAQSAAEYKHQFDGLSDRYRVIGIDMRGHGESDKPDHGYHIHRLSKDVHEFLTAKELTEVTLVGHSMGCEVIWGYWELFGSDRLGKLILIDQSAMPLANPSWSEQEKLDAGSFVNPETLFDLINGVNGLDGAQFRRDFMSRNFSTNFSRDELNWVISENLKMPGDYAARLLLNAVTMDWREIIPQITIPTLVVSSLGIRVSRRWIASMIPHATLAGFELADGGSHFMFMEIPEKFNQVVREFLSAGSSEPDTFLSC
jgi:pimeloyl-ACP methyl ester carboxylesterase